MSYEEVGAARAHGQFNIVQMAEGQGFSCAVAGRFTGQGEAMISLHVDNKLVVSEKISMKIKSNSTLFGLIVGGQSGGVGLTKYQGADYLVMKYVGDTDSQTRISKIEISCMGVIYTASLNTSEDLNALADKLSAVSAFPVPAALHDANVTTVNNFKNSITDTLPPCVAIDGTGKGQLIVKTDVLTIAD